MLVTILVLIILSQMYFNSARKFRKEVLKKTMKIFLEKMQASLTTDKFGIGLSTGGRKWKLKISRKEYPDLFECEFDDLRFEVKASATAKLPRALIKMYSSGDFESISFLMNQLDNFIAAIYITSTKKFFWENLISDFSKSNLSREIKFLINKIEVVLFWDKESAMVVLSFSGRHEYSGVEFFAKSYNKDAGLTIMEKHEIISYLKENLGDEPFSIRRNLEILRVTALSLNDWNEEKIERYQIPTELRDDVFETLA